MFNSEIKKLREENESIKSDILNLKGFAKHLQKQITALQKDSKQSHCWELREEEFELIKEGKNMKIIRKILE